MHDAALIVDLDGTLTPTDTLAESIIQAIRQNPFIIFLLPFWLVRGRAALKCALAARVTLAIDKLPYRTDVLAFLKGEKARGRDIVLATAAHRTIAEGVAKHLGLFSAVIATHDRLNAKGAIKLRQIEQTVGTDFVYAGDSGADLPVWAAANGAILVDVSANIEARVRRSTRIEHTFAYERSGWRAWSKALRVHQWLKNLLIFVPLFTAFASLNSAIVRDAALAFLAMSLSASATYVLNDLWDLDNDRAHPRKRMRPFASGQLPVLQGMMVAGLLLCVSLVIAFFTSLPFACMLLGYIALTSLYSWWLKSRVLIDVFTLSVLYTWRILAGSVAVHIEISKWLLAFSVFVFLSLALIKRCSELHSLEQSGQASATGRDYQVSDLVVLWPLGVAATLSAVVVFGLFINAPETALRYSMPNLLWLVALILTYLLCRLWIKTVRGQMHDDPIVFVLRDAKSAGLVVLIGVIMLMAHFLH